MIGMQRLQTQESLWVALRAGYETGRGLGMDSSRARYRLVDVSVTGRLVRLVQMVR